MTETIQDLKTANDNLAKNLKRAKNAAESLKAEASRAKYYKNKFQEKEDILAKAKYELKIWKIIVKAATTGLKYSNGFIKVTLDEQKLVAFDKGLSGKGQQAQIDYVTSHLQDFCAVAVKSKKEEFSKCQHDNANINIVPGKDSVIVGSLTAHKYLKALDITLDLTSICNDHKSALTEKSIAQVCLMEDQYNVALAYQNNDSVNIITQNSTDAGNIPFPTGVNTIGLPGQLSEVDANLV